MGYKLLPLANMDANQAVFDRDAAIYTDVSLKPPERKVMAEMHERLNEIEMLDLGVGSGRTGYTFAALVGRYVGLDYSPRMIERARQLLGTDDRVELVVGDARDLSSVNGPFDFVLFSFNGIDAVGHEDRLRILAEVRGVLKPDGRFLFSAHSLGAIPLTTKRPRQRNRSLLDIREILSSLEDARYAWRVRQSNRAIDLDAARRRGWTVIRDVAHGFNLQVYYVDRAEQLKQLGEAGLEAIAILDETGREVEPQEARRDPWFNYLCRPL